MKKATTPACKQNRFRKVYLLEEGPVSELLVSAALRQQERDEVLASSSRQRPS